jgi:PAS domain S-box-containing protein
MVLEQSSTLSNAARFSVVPRVFGKIPLYWVMVLPLVIQVSGAVATVGWLSHRNGQQAVNEIATQLRNESSSRIRQHLDDYLLTPVQLNQTNVDAINLGLLDLKNFQTAGKYFWRQMQTFNVGYISFGNPKGEFIGVERQDDGRLLINEQSPATKHQLLAYETDGKGDRSRLFRTTPNYNPLIEGWYADAVKAGKPIWSSIYNWDDQPNVLSIAASYPLYDPNNQLIGVISVDQILTQISTFLSEIKVSNNGRTFIMERSGDLVATSSKDEPPFRIIHTGNKARAERLKAFDSKDSLIQSSSKYLADKFRHLDQITQSQQVDYSIGGQRQFLLVMPWQDRHGLDWLIVVVVPESDFMTQINANTHNTILSCAIALALAILIGIPTSRWIARQILHLSQASEALANGHLSQTVQAKGIAELETLATSFNRMAAQLRESFAVLEKNNEVLEQRVEERTALLAAAEAELRALFTAMTDVVIVYDRQGQLQRIVSSNPAYLINPIPEQVGKTIHEMMPTAQANEILRAIQQTLQTRQVVSKEYSLSIQGQEVWFSANISPLSEDTVIWVARDISDRKRIENEHRRSELALRQSEQQLRQHNRVLLDLAKSTVLNQGELDRAVREITEAAAETLKVERVSVWLLNEQGSALVCLDLFERSLHHHSSGTELTTADFPQYFQALETETSIITNSPQQAIPTQGFTETYLDPIGLTALLDTPIRCGHKIVGVVCLEQVGENRRWSVEEQSFARSMADLIALGMAAQERRLTEQALQISQEKFAKAFSASPDFITISSLETGRLIDVNESFLETSGFSRQEVLGKTAFELGAWVNRRDWIRLHHLLIKQGYVKDLEIWLRNKSEATMIGLISAEIIELEDEPCVLAVTKDITDRKLAEAAIRESQQKYRDLVESANSIILRWDTTGHITFLNKYGLRFFGFQEGDIVGQHVLGTIVPEAETSGRDLQTLMADICNNPEHYQDNENENIRQDGQKVWVKWANKAIVDEQGQLVEILSVGFDITDRKRAEAALQEKEQYLRLILNNIPQQVFWKDTNLVFMGCNENWAQAAQLSSPEAIVGKTDYDLVPSRELADEFRIQDRQIIETDEPKLHIVARKVKSDSNKPRWLDISKIPIHDAENNVIGVLGVIEDITLRKQAEEALQAEQERSERLLRNVLPKLIADQLKQSLELLEEQHTRALIAESFDEVTILFADITNFTQLSANISASELVGLLNRIFLVFDDLSEKHGLEKIKTIGDSYMVVGGLPTHCPNHAEAIADMALDILQEIDQFRTYEGHPIAVRIGINTGQVIAGVIGKRKFAYDLWGDAVNAASRMESHGVPGRIQVTEATYQRLKDQYRFEPRGPIEVKGKGEMSTYWLIGKIEI